MKRKIHFLQKETLPPFNKQISSINRKIVFSVAKGKIVFAIREVLLLNAKSSFFFHKKKDPFSQK